MILFPYSCYMNKFIIFLVSSIDEIVLGIFIAFILNYFSNVDSLIYILLFSVLSVVILFKFYIFYPHFKRPFTGREGIIGNIGIVVKNLNPIGQVKIHGEIWKARSIKGNINKDEKVRVVDVDGLELIVYRKEKF